MTGGSGARNMSAFPGIAWRRIVVDLEQRGYTHASIGSVIGVSRAAVESWKNRYIEPSHQKGERIISLWCAVTGLKREDMPRNDEAPQIAKI